MDSNPSNMEGHAEFVPGTTIESLYNNQIVVFTHHCFDDVEVIAAFYDKLLDMVQCWKISKPFVALYDSSRVGVHWTPYIRQRSHEFMDLTRGRKIITVSAVVMARNPLAQMVSLFVRSMQRDRDNSDYRIFYDRTEALQWLEQWLLS